MNCARQTITRTSQRLVSPDAGGSTNSSGTSEAGNEPPTERSRPGRSRVCPAMHICSYVHRRGSAQGDRVRDVGRGLRREVCRARGRCGRRVPPGVPAWTSRGRPTPPAASSRSPSPTARTTPSPRPVRRHITRAAHAERRSRCASGVVDATTARRQGRPRSRSGTPTLPAVLRVGRRQRPLPAGIEPHGPRRRVVLEPSARARTVAARRHPPECFRPRQRGPHRPGLLPRRVYERSTRRSSTPRAGSRTPPTPEHVSRGASGRCCVEREGRPEARAHDRDGRRATLEIRRHCGCGEIGIHAGLRRPCETP